MKRRQFLQATAALAAQAGLAQTTGTANKLKIDAYSRHLHWLRTADEVADAAIEMGFEGLDITVRTYPGHVDPAKVATDLPPFVNAVRKRGLQVTTITTNISDADSPFAEDILRAASSLGITHYWWGTYRYDGKSPIMAQLDALKPRVAKLAALNAKYKMKAMYHTYSGNVLIGSALWDMLYVMREFDPAHISFHYDTGHQTNAGGNGTWTLGMRAAGPYIGGISVKDSLIESTFTPSGGGGPFSAQPNATAAERTPAPNGAPANGRPPNGAAPASGPPGDAGTGWRVRQVPLGTGTVNLPLFAQVVKEIGFYGPLEIQSEYPNGGADNGLDKITLSRQIVLGAMKRDRLVLRQALAAAGLA